MPLFITDEELESLRSNVTFIVSKADSFITSLQRQLETVKAQAEASSITAEQTCSVVEQKYISLSSDFEKLESQNAELNAAIERNIEELAVVKSEKHRIQLESIEKDGTIERLWAEIMEKNTTTKSYLDRIVKVTEAAALKQSQLHEREAEFARSQATCARLSQEKELIEKHNVWLNEELTTKVHDLIQVRMARAEAEADISAKLADAEKSYNECSSSLKWNKERVKELEGKLASLQEELCNSKTTAAENEERFTAELSTVSKLVELYKESSEEQSRKAGDFEVVIKALETHLAQVENDYTEKLEKEVSARLLLEKAAADLKEKLNKCDVEIENYRKANELSLLEISSFERWTDRGGAGNGLHDGDHMIVPKIPVGVSGTALAASLLCDGWSLAKMYEKCQEAVDALQHESMGRKQSQAILERRLRELAQNTGAEMKHLETMVEEKKIEVDSCRKEIEILGVEKGNLENRIAELLNMYKNIDIEDYSRMKEDFHQMQRMFENLTKEKEEWTKEKQTLVRQEESRQGKRPLGDTSSEQAMKEKEARIQILERTIEREREEHRKEKEEHRNEKEELLKEKEEHHKEKEKHLKEKEEHRKEKVEHQKEKALLLKNQEIYEAFLKRANQERDKLVQEIERHNKQLSDYGFTSGGSSGDAQTVEPTEIGCVCSRHSTCGTVNCVCCSKKLPCTPSCSCKRERCTRRFSLHSL